jgi:hypothetical protein
MHKFEKLIKGWMLLWLLYIHLELVYYRCNLTHLTHTNLSFIKTSKWNMFQTVNQNSEPFGKNILNKIKSMNVLFDEVRNV